VRVQRPGTDGKYSFVDLPPGDYVLAAVSDMEPDAWRDPAFLRSLVVGGVRVTIGEGEQKTQDVRIGRATISGRGDNGMFSEPAMIALDAGRTFNGAKPPAELSFGDIRIPNPRKDSPPRTILTIASEGEPFKTASVTATVR
jgi:hypothetical protein